jgi:hypothetical protein
VSIEMMHARARLRPQARDERPWGSKNDEANEPRGRVSAFL